MASFTNALRAVQGFRDPDPEFNAYIDIGITCSCCDTRMVWLKKATMTVFRCESEGCPQYKKEFLPPKFKLEEAK